MNQSTMALQLTNGQVFYLYHVKLRKVKLIEINYVNLVNLYKILF